MATMSAATWRSSRPPAAPSSAPARQARIPGIEVEVDDGDRYRFGEAEAEVFFIPGHTSGHIAYAFRDQRALFCGDTIFALGCGKMFEGTPQQFWTSLSRLRSLPDDMRVYCAHEYTQSNARFAVTVETDNQQLMARRASVDAARARGEATVPSLLGEEKQTNPFLRADLPACRRPSAWWARTPPWCSPRSATARTCSARPGEPPALPHPEERAYPRLTRA